VGLDHERTCIAQLDVTWMSGQDGAVARPADKRLSFNEVPDLYDEIRPTYPAELYDVLFAMLPSAPGIVEVGPGTGQATKDLLAARSVRSRR
jgi:hypothetical protein